MKSVEIEKLLSADASCVLAYRPTRAIERENYSPVYIRGISRSMGGQWRYGEIKTPPGWGNVSEWRSDQGTFKPGEVITESEANAIVQTNERRQREHVEWSSKVLAAAGRMRLHGFAAWEHGDGVLVDPDWLIGQLGSPVIEMDRLAFCETVAAVGPWHIRRVSGAGRKPNGGADTVALCGAKAAWDIQVPVTPEALNRVKPCPWCATVIREAM